jgi:hypothetical protein
MNKAKQKRNNEYYLERLHSEHPVVYSDFQSGRFKNLSEALIKAGIREKRTGFDTLKSVWKKAGTAERDAFKAFIGCTVPTVASATVATSVAVKSAGHTATATSGKGHLPPALKDAVNEIMKRRCLKSGQVMREIGRNPWDGSLGTALHRGTKIQDSMIADLEVWATKNKAP